MFEFARLRCARCRAYFHPALLEALPNGLWQMECTCPACGSCRTVPHSVAIVATFVALGAALGSVVATYAARVNPTLALAIALIVFLVALRMMLAILTRASANHPA